MRHIKSFGVHYRTFTHHHATRVYSLMHENTYYMIYRTLDCVQDNMADVIEVAADLYTRKFPLLGGYLGVLYNDNY